MEEETNNAASQTEVPLRSSYFWPIFSVFIEKIITKETHTP
jgi:hypothetical protein